MATRSEVPEPSAEPGAISPARRLSLGKTSPSVLDLWGRGRQDSGHAAAGVPAAPPKGGETGLKANAASIWSVAESAELYGVRSWGAGYFELSDDGTVAVSVPFNGKRARVSLLDIMAGMQQRGLQMPVLLRIENILDAQVSLLNESFGRAMRSLSYRGSYRGVFPIKVNQQCQVIEEIARFGATYGHGLECGSKAELLIALSSLDPDASHIVCNGYKDDEFISLGLQATRLGYRVTFVLETPTELPLIIAASKRLG